MKTMLTLLAFAALSIQAKEPRKNVMPNIVLILADDMGKDSVSAFNGKLGFKTPRMDQLVAQGMTFTEAHSGSALCTPTRYGLLTGRYAWRSRLKRGVVMEWEVPLIEEGRLTLAETLKRKGYDTACIGKWHLGWNWPFKSKEPVPFGKAELSEHALKGVDWSRPVSGGPIDLGFDYYFGDGAINYAPFAYIENDRVLGTPDPEQKWRAPDSNWAAERVLPTLTDKALSYIEKQSKTDDPFFLYFPMSSPHSPIVPSAKFKGISGISPYADFVIQTDDSIGQIINAVDRAGIAENTLIIVTSDNGTALNLAKRVGLTMRDGTLDKGIVDFEVNMRGGKFDIEEGGHKVPFIVRWKGTIAPGTTNSTPVCLTDIMATAADIAGYDLPDSAAEDSVSLLPALMNKPFERNPIINHDAPGDFAIRSGDWKLIIRFTPKGKKTAEKAGLPPVHLYNVSEDPRELNNRAEQYPELVSRLTKELRTIINNGRSTPGTLQQNAGRTWMPTDEKYPTAAAKWTTIFNGKDIKGWEKKGGEADYKVEDGCIVGTTKPKTPNTFLCPPKKYGDFELIFEVKCDPALNSGVQIRSISNADEVPVGLSEADAVKAKKKADGKSLFGPQVEIAANGNAAGVWFEGVGGWLLAPKTEITNKAYKKEGWNVYRVLAKGEHIRVWINGTKISDGKDTRTRFAKGRLGFQVHGVGNKTEPLSVRWKNIRIREVE